MKVLFEQSNHIFFHYFRALACNLLEKNNNFDSFSSVMYKTSKKINEKWKWRKNVKHIFFYIYVKICEKMWNKCVSQNFQLAHFFFLDVLMPHAGHISKLPTEMCRDVTLATHLAFLCEKMCQSHLVTFALSREIRHFSPFLTGTFF